MSESNNQLLRVLCLTRAYGQHAGGMERLSYELIQELKQQPNIQISLLANITPSEQPLTWIRIRSLFFMLCIIPRALLSARTVDVVHLGDPLLALVGWLIGKIYHKPVVVVVHGLDVSYPHPLYRLYLRLFFHSFNAYIPISEHVAHLLATHRVRGNIHVISPGIHDTYYNPSYTRLQLERFVHRPLYTMRVFCTAGRLVQRKGHAWFIQEVFSHLPPDTLYVIAGSGPEAEEIKQSAVRAGVHDRVLLLGRIADEDLRMLYNTVDAFIQPNISVTGEAEGFGIVLLEAASCGLPVFAASREGIPAAIHHGNNGHLLPAGDSQQWIAALSTFTPYTAAQKQSTRAYTLRNFSWSTIAKAHASVLRGVMTV